ncbi:hypothetical protein [Burkholderia sp. PAMC 26561]|uniref:Uncharacterized protein n=1 Tax=Caballeronia sordidicola TaxID=196367 RepID=A0A242N3W9_CABSO|nr:hypothetical protein [Burkholderia sp. PAMC 26561]OTP78370.1 hypothetical protein PAMC26577_06925 [Caballeronia sordidicola]
MQSGEFVELPSKPVPPPIVISLCKPVNASAMVNAAANAADIACSAYSHSIKKDFLESL